MKTTAIGRGAEEAVAKYLEHDGFNILAKNWRTRWCEIDLIATKDKIAYFVEVKYRGGQTQGSGFEYIGPSKLRQLNFAVDFWVSSRNWTGDCRIIGAQVSGLEFEHIEIVEIS